MKVLIYLASDEVNPSRHRAPCRCVSLPKFSLHLTGSAALGTNSPELLPINSPVLEVWRPLFQILS